MSFQYIVVNINYSQPMANGPFHNLELAKEYAEDVFPYGGFWILPTIQPTPPTWKNPNRQKTEPRRTAMSEKCYPQKGKRYVTASGEITGPLREGIMPGQFAFSCDHLHTSWHDNGVHAGFNNSKNLVRELEESKAPAPEADSTSETPRTDDEEFMPIDSQCYPIVVRSSFARQLERELAQAKKRLIDAEEILAELASGYWRKTLNNIDDRPTRPDWPMGELIQLYWEKHNQGEQP